MAHQHVWSRMRVFLCLLAFTAPSVVAADSEGGVGVRHLRLVDDSRSVKAVNGFSGSPVRRVDVAVWYPAKLRSGAAAGEPVEGAASADGKPWPLVLYSHGSYGHADNAMHLVKHLVRSGYVVAAPDYPLTSRAAYTQVTGVDLTDVIHQTGDIRFIIDHLLRDEQLSGVIDKDRIATVGHSLGAVTSYFASFGAGIRDPRIRATVLIGAGDPVQAALAADMGMMGVWHFPAVIPVLFLSAQMDPFALVNGRPYAAYSRLEKPKYEVMVKGGNHIWFRDGANQPVDGSNPDCAMLAGFRPGITLPGCEAGVPLISPLRQQEITRIAVGDFLDGYLKDDAERRGGLRNLPVKLPEVELRYEE